MQVPFIPVTRITDAELDPVHGVCAMEKERENEQATGQP
jgi:hypothetical protein